MAKPTIETKRVYDDPGDDGYRVLVDRLWPRGLSKEDAQLDDWAKELAPSDSLRQRFHDDELNWHNFRKAYEAELKDGQAAEAAEDLLDAIASKSKVTLLYGSKNEEENNAIVLKQWLENKL